ncbi:hypothetical protein JHK86_005173 [Glycine max]|nr:hypothetical protein JHK86_005173 [Glycine max]
MAYDDPMDDVWNILAVKTQNHIDSPTNIACDILNETKQLDLGSRESVSDLPMPFLYKGWANDFGPSDARRPTTRFNIGRKVRYLDLDSVYVIILLL